MNKWLIGLIGLAVIGVVGYLIGTRSPSVTTPKQVGTMIETTPSDEAPVATTGAFKATDVPGVSKKYNFSATIPASWQAEYVAAIDSINLYDPVAAGENNLEKSQIFIRNFSGNDFLTLSTVTIFSRTTTTVAGQSAVRYDIEKKAGVANFANQPSWRSTRHIVTDVKLQSTQPSLFLVIASRPDGDRAIYQKFLDSILFSGQTALLNPPVGLRVDEFKSRITKKKFGTFVTPKDSPVQPERFAGFHTGVDVEYGDQPGREIEVVSVGDGEVVRASQADGYGGMVVVRQDIRGTPHTIVYGHLKVNSLPKVGVKLNQGDRIGILGEGGSTDTDGERKHLHFGIRTDATVDIKGYVQKKEDLSGWIDPLTLY